MTTITPFIKKELLDDNNQFVELGAMAGVQRKRSTYFREYKHNAADDVRLKVEKALQRGDEGIILLGEEYSYTPRNLFDGRNFSRLHIESNSIGAGGGFFLVTETLNEEAKNQSSLRYVTQKLKLDSLCGLSIKDLWFKCENFGDGYLLSHFFDPVDYPQENDLVVYSGNESHFGIFRESKRNWNSPHGGTVESKWDSSIRFPFVFQHDIFFVPPNYGDSAQFYRLKSEPVMLENLEIRPHEGPSLSQLTSNAVYTVQGDHSLTLNLTEENLQRRALIDKNKGKDLKNVPEIEILSTTFFGICHNYAVTSILNTRYTFIEKHLSEILEKYFIPTSEPQKGDLVEYYAGGNITHSGIYLGEERVESKWGKDKHPCRHFFFDAPTSYGNTIKCFRLKSDLDKEKLVEALKSIYYI